MELIRKYGWRPQRPDSRDRLYTFTRKSGTINYIDPMTAFSPAWDQSQIGSCTGNGVGAQWQHRMHAEHKGIIMPSRLFIYYNARFLENDVPYDNGASVRDALMGVVKFGVPKEKLWQYDISKFADTPPAPVYAAAAKDVALQYHAVPADVDLIKVALEDGNPVVGGFTVYHSFEYGSWSTPGQSGIMPMPASNEQVLGGHCVLWDGFDDSTSTFWCRNSWGQNWGTHSKKYPGRYGWFKMPYDYIAKNCSDFWVMTKVA